MPYDMDESQMLGELQDLEDEIEALATAIWYLGFIQGDDSNKKRINILNRLFGKLEQDKERLESRLRIHRQKVAESGVKY